MTLQVPFDQLTDADLTVEATYEGGTRGNAADDPLARLLPCGNQGGFRFKGRRSQHDYRLGLLYTSGEDRDWPDSLDPERGIFTYFGDNKRPGAGLHETPRGGNELLRFAFSCRHGDASQRRRIPPFFVFQKANPSGRDVSFLGLAVPGAGNLDELSDLVAIWRTALDRRFQNYRATFTILDVPTIKRAWIEELVAGERLGPSCPSAFRSFVEDGVYLPLEAQRTIEFRSPREQLPSAADRSLLDAIYTHYTEVPHRFETCAIELWRMFAAEPIEVTPTRPSADGGRDAIGRYPLARQVIAFPSTSR